MEKRFYDYFMFLEKRKKDRFTFYYGLNEKIEYSELTTLLAFLQNEIRFYIKNRFPDYIGKTVRVIIKKDGGSRIYVWRSIALSIY